MEYLRYTLLFRKNMRQIYSLFLYLSLPFLLIRLWWKGRKNAVYRSRILERFTLNKMTGPVDIWVHAVSLGEVIAVAPLVAALVKKQYKILMTTTTPSGSQRVRQQFGDAVLHQFLPYDLNCVMRRFYRKIQPRMVMLVETELWPNLIHNARYLGVPILLINGRLSEQSFRGYKKTRYLWKNLLKAFHSIFVQTEEDAARYQALGACSEKIQVCGNIKFDLEIPTVVNEAIAGLKTKWGSERTVFIAASTHNNEEELILSHLNKLGKEIENILLLIAPRHPERFQKVYELSKEMGFTTGLRSNSDSLSSEHQVIVLDCLGELLEFYRLSDYAFVGGSFVPVGGHNPLEPIAMKVPVWCGPFFHNFKAICQDLKRAEAITIVDRVDDLIISLISFHRNKEKITMMVNNATQVLEANKGILDRYLTEVESILNKTKTAGTLCFF